MSKLAKGKITAYVDTPRSIEHLNPTSLTHRLDQARSKEKRQFLSRLEPLITKIPIHARLPSLGDGFMMDPDGIEMSSADHNALLGSAKVERRVYYITQYRSDGRSFKQKRYTKAVRQMGVTFPPEINLALARLEESTDFTAKTFVKEAAVKVARAFKTATGYDVLEIQVHPKEGCLHFHITYAVVTKNHELIHAKESMGRPGPHFLGPALTGALRHGDHGLLPADRLSSAKGLLKDRCKNGIEPIDWRMAEMLDGICEQFVAGQSKEARKVFSDAFNDYRKMFTEADLNTPENLLARLKSVEEENKAKDVEIERLRARITPAQTSAEESPTSEGSSTAYSKTHEKSLQGREDFAHSAERLTMSPAIETASPSLPPSPVGQSLLKESQKRLIEARQTTEQLETENARLRREIAELKRALQPEKQSGEQPAASVESDIGTSYKSPKNPQQKSQVSAFQPQPPLDDGIPLS